MKNKENLYASIPYVDKKVSRIFAGTAFSPIQDGADGTDFFEAAFAVSGADCNSLPRVIHLKYI